MLRLLLLLTAPAWLCCCQQARRALLLQGARALGQEHLFMSAQIVCGVCVHTGRRVVVQAAGAVSAGEHIQ